MASCFCFVPRTDSCTAQTASLFNRVIGAGVALLARLALTVVEYPGIAAEPIHDCAEASLTRVEPRKSVYEYTPSTPVVAWSGVNRRAGSRQVLRREERPSSGQEAASVDRGADT